MLTSGYLRIVPINKNTQILLTSCPSNLGGKIQLQNHDGTCHCNDEDDDVGNDEDDDPTLKKF